MAAPTISISSLEALQQYVAREHHPQWRRWRYRGHSKASYRLVPKVGRDARMAGMEAKLFKAWKQHSVAFLDNGLTEWDRIAIAQHHGLATRLLDWTFNPLAAAFFATVKADGAVDTDHDCAIYAHYSTLDPIEQADPRAPLLIEGIRRYVPSAVVPRIVRQGGIFTIHGPATLDLEDHVPPGDQLQKLVIAKECKLQLAQQLSHFGVNQLSMFPDLDGVSRHVNWTFQHLPDVP